MMYINSPRVLVSLFTVFHPPSLSHLPCPSAHALKPSWHPQGISVLIRGSHQWPICNFRPTGPKPNPLSKNWLRHMYPPQHSTQTHGLRQIDPVHTHQEPAGTQGKGSSSDIDLQTVHTQVFKRASRGFGDHTEHQLQIVEQCSHGEQRNRRPEFFFHGILGHVKDWYGNPIDTWDNANKISNYWRRFYEIPEVSYEESGAWEQPQASQRNQNPDLTDPPFDPFQSQRIRNP